MSITRSSWRRAATAVAAAAGLICIGRAVSAAPAADDPLPARSAAADGLRSAPDDPIFPLQWHHAVLGTAAAWDVVDGAGVTVAIVDSGVACDHPDLRARCVPGWDFVDGDAAPDDAVGTGTAMAGIVAATAGNGEGVAGLAPGAAIMPLRVVDAGGGVDVDALAGAVTWAADHGAQVVVVGVAGRHADDALRDAVAGAVARGVTLVASLGGEDANERLFPAAYPGVIGVGVTDRDDARVPVTSFGDTVDVAAPGVDILSTTPDGGYFGHDGAHAAAAVAAGVAALLKAQRPDRPPMVVEELLRVSATDLGAPGWDPYFGAGRIHARRALDLDPGHGGVPPVPSAPAAPTLPGGATAAPPQPATPTPAPTDPPRPTRPPWGPTPTLQATFPTSTPGPLACQRPWQISLVALPDLSGAGGFICPGCDGVMSSADRFLSTLCPLQPLEIVITDGDVGIGSTAKRVLWHGFVQRSATQTHEIRHVVMLCDPPPYHVTLLTTEPEHYTLCPNSDQTQAIDQKSFDRFSNSRPGEGRRDAVAWSFWSCAARGRP